MSIMLDVFAKLVSLWGQHRLVVMLVGAGHARAVMNSFRVASATASCWPAAPVSSAVPEAHDLGAGPGPQRRGEHRCLPELAGGSGVPAL